MIGKSQDNAMSENFSTTANKEGKKSNLEILGLSGIFQKIAEDRRSGILVAQIKNDEMNIGFKDGVVQIIASPNRPSILAEGLRRAFHEIDDNTLENLFYQQGISGDSLSQILLEMGAERNFIKDVCVFQIQEEVYSLFRWADIRLEFLENKKPEEVFPRELLSLDIALDPEILLMEAARRLDEWTSIQHDLPSGQDIPYIAQDIYEDQLTPEEIHLLSLVDGGGDFEEIVSSCRVPEFQTWQLFQSMYQQGYIALRTDQELKEMAELDEFKENLYKCIKLYERAETLGSKDVDTIQWLAEAYESKGLIAKAIAKYKELGEFFLEKKNFSGAIDAYEQVINYSSEDLDAHEKLINVLFEDGQFIPGAQASIVYAKKLALEDKRKSIQVLEDAYQYNPLSPEVLETMATFYYELGENIDAIFTYTTLANLYKSRELYKDTINSYEKILSLDGNNIEARIELANTYLVMGEHEKGVLEYKKLGDILTDSHLLQQPFVFSYLINVCEKIIEFEPDNLSAREWLADVYLYHKKISKAKEVLLEVLSLIKPSENLNVLVSILRKLVQIDPENRDYCQRLAETYHTLNKKNEATQVLINLANFSWEKAEETVAQDQDARSIYEECIESLDMAITIDPFHLEIRQKRAKVLEALSYTKEAIEEYKLISHMTKAVHNHYDNLSALYHLLELAPEEEFFAYLELARLCERQNNFDLAIRFYKKYVYFCLEKGDFGEVLLVCRRLVVLAPEDEEVQNWRKVSLEITKS